MASEVFAGGVQWTPEPDEEFNQHSATIKGRKITVFSDREEGKWEYMVDDGDLCSLEATHLHDALAEAAKEARQL
jgi:hypothetical protein